MFWLVLSELELPTRRSPNSGLTGPGGCISDFLEAIENFWTSFIQILWPPYTKTTGILLIVWATTAFGFYGMSIWFPEYVRKLQEEEYESHASVYANTSVANQKFGGSLTNHRFENVRFQNDIFDDIVLIHCVFNRCHFENVTFDKVHSSRTFFYDSEFKRVTFEKTDFFEYKFINCHFKSSTFRNTDEGCGVDFDLNFNLTDVFTENMIAQAAIIPGSILSSLVLDRFGRVKTMVTSLFLTSVSAFFIWFIDTKHMVIAFEGMFNFISISGWNAVDVITTESYPASLRSTGYGFLSAVSRLAAVGGNLLFAHFISISKTLPILTTSAVLMVGALSALKLQETKDTLM